MGLLTELGERWRQERAAWKSVGGQARLDARREHA